MLECVTFGFMERADRGAVRRDAGGAAPGQPDRRRSRPDAAHAGRHACCWPPRATPRAAIADVALAESARAYRDQTPAGQLRSPPACAPGTTPRHWAEPARAGGCAWTPRAMRWRCWPRSACRWRRCRSPPMRRASTIRAVRGVVRQGPKTVLATFGEMHPKVLAALDLPGPAVAFEVFLDADPRAEAPQEGRARPAGLPAAAARLRLPGGCRRRRRGAAARRPRRRRALIADVALFDRYAGREAAGGQGQPGHPGDAAAARARR